MKIFSHLTYQLFLIYFLYKKFSFNLLFKKYKKNSKNVVWIFPQFPFGLVKYFGSAAVFQDMALIFSLLKEIDDFRFFVGPKIGSLRKVNFFYSFTDKHNPFLFESNSRFLSSKISLLESQDCKVYPKLSDLRLWEDKEHMYKMFNKYKIPFPRTVIFKTFDEESSILDSVRNFSFPFLVKEHFGNHSKGIFHISDFSEFKDILLLLKKKKVSTFAVQELINDETDYRVIIVGSKILQTYKRDKKNSKGWVTTSTSNGSVIDFSPLTKELEEKFIHFSNLLDLSNAAFDASINDNKITVYEVSSSYLTNPEPSKKYRNKAYIDFKKSYRDFAKSRVDIVFFLRHQWIKEQLKDHIL